MTLAITHEFVSAKAQSADSSIVSKNEWNAGHVISAGALSILGRSANSNGTVSDIQVSASTGYVLRESGGILGFGTITAGAVIGLPTSSTDNAAVRFDGTAGAMQNSGVIISDTNVVSGVSLLTVGGSDANIDGVSLTSLQNSSRMLIGNNRSSGGGETDFISNQGGGSTGGFWFYDYSNSGTLTNLIKFRRQGFDSRMTNPTQTGVTVPTFSEVNPPSSPHFNIETTYSGTGAGSNPDVSLRVQAYIESGTTVSGSGGAIYGGTLVSQTGHDPFGILGIIASDLAGTNPYGAAIWAISRRKAGPNTRILQATAENDDGTHPGYGLLIDALTAANAPTVGAKIRDAVDYGLIIGGGGPSVPVTALSVQDGSNIEKFSILAGGHINIGGIAKFNYASVATLDGVSLTTLANSGQLWIGNNRSSGGAEYNFIVNRGGGSVGGYRFYDYTNAGSLNLLLTLLGDGSAIQAGSQTANSFIPASSTIPTNGMYLPAANTLGWAINSSAELQLTSTALAPAVDGGSSLGTTSFSWQNLFGNTGFVLNIEASDWVATHTAGILTIGTGTLKITTPTNTATSVVTIDGTQTLTNKSIAQTQLTGFGTGVSTALAVNVGSAGAFVTFNGALGTPSSGTVTNLTGTASININGTVGATTPAAGTFTALIASTSLTSPLYIGGSGTTGTQLTIQTTSGNGITDALVVKGGNNGATIFATLNSTKLDISQSTQSTTTTTGALTIAGGIGVVKDAYFGGQLLITPASGNTNFIGRLAANTSFLQFLFQDQTSVYRGYVGYIGSSGGLGARDDTVEFGTNGKDLTIRPGETEQIRFISGGLIKFTATNNFTANATSIVTISALGPAGITATVAKWLTIRDSGGTISYIPVWQ